jgi:hypothetical protein
MDGSRGSDTSPPDNTPLSDARAVVELALFQTAGALARSAEFAPLRLSPDAVATVSVNGRLHRTAIEVDVAANESAKTIASKLTRYQEVFARGQVDELWFVVAAPSRRLDQLAHLVRDARLDAMTRLLPHELVGRRPVEPPPPMVTATPPGSDESGANPQESQASPPLRSGTFAPEPKYDAREGPRW